MKKFEIRAAFKIAQYLMSVKNIEKEFVIPAPQLLGLIAKT
jgi:hypothetical protein